MTSSLPLPVVDEVLVDWAPGEIRVALLHDGRPWELLVSRASRPTLVGNVYLGRVVGIDRGLEAAFLDIGEAAPGMLRFARGRRRPPHDGERMVVQVTRDAFADKGPVLTASARLAGRYLVLTPGRPGIAASRRIADPEARQRLQGLVKRSIGPDQGVVIRTAAAANEADIPRELDLLRTTWQKIEARAAETDPPALLHRELAEPLAYLRDVLPAQPVPVQVDDRRTAGTLARFFAERLPNYSGFLSRHDGPTPLFEERQVEAEIEAARERDWPLPGGGSIAVEQTRALTAIDVDTGSAGSRRASGSDRMAVNIAAAREAARLIRFRNVSGLIVVDFAGAGAQTPEMPLIGAVRDGFFGDRAAVRVGTVSEHGLLELSRERLGPSLFELVAGDPPQSWAMNVETNLLSQLRALVRRRPPPSCCVLEVSDAEAALLDGKLADARSEAEQRLGYPVEVARPGPG